MPKTVLLNSRRMSSSDSNPRAEVSAALQSTVAKVKVDLAHQEKLNRAFLDGALIILSIGQKRWTTRLTQEMIQHAYRVSMAQVQLRLNELGEEMSEETNKLREELAKLRQQFEAAGQLPDNFKLGRAFLIPEARIQKINHIESMARGCLDRRSFEFGGESRAKFRFVNKKMVLDTLIELADFEKAFFVEVDSLIADYESLKAGMKEKYPDQWPIIEQFYPAVEEIRGEYSFTYQARAMTFPKTLDGIDLEEWARKDSVDKEYRAKAEKVLADQRSMAQRQAKQFIEEALRTVRGKAVDVINGVLKKITDGKDITDTNVSRMRTLIDEVGKMDFLNDSAFHAQLNKVREQLDATRKYKDNNTAVKALEAVLKGTVDFVTQTTDSAATAAVTNYFQRDLNI